MFHLQVNVWIKIITLDDPTITVAFVVITANSDVRRLKQSLETEIHWIGIMCRSMPPPSILLSIYFYLNGCVIKDWYIPTPPPAPSPFPVSRRERDCIRRGRNVYALISEWSKWSARSGVWSNYIAELYTMYLHMCRSWWNSPRWRKYDGFQPRMKVVCSTKW